MRTRKTSKDAYRNLIDSGVLAEKNSIVYKHLFVCGATTQKKTERFFNDRTYTLRPRFAQLEKMGLIEVVGEEDCLETGKKNTLWDVTSRVQPLELKKTSKTKKDRIKDAVDSMRDLYFKRHTSSDEDWKEVVNLIKSI